MQAAEKMRQVARPRLAFIKAEKDKAVPCLFELFFSPLTCIFDTLKCSQRAAQEPQRIVPVNEIQHEPQV
jgi:hypothetical protein